MIATKTTARAEIKTIYDHHIADKLNFGRGKNREMLIAVPFWAVEALATGRSERKDGRGNSRRI